jgi:hypothetical protein
LRSRVGERRCVKKSCPYGIALFSWHGVQLFQRDTTEKSPAIELGFVLSGEKKIRVYGLMAAVALAIRKDRDEENGIYKR